MNTINRLRQFLLTLAILAGVGVPARADVFLVPDASGDRIARVNSAGAVTTVPTTGLNTPEQAVFDAEGNLFVADSGLGMVVQFPAAGGGPLPVGDAVAGVTSLAFDADGVLHVAVPGDRTIRKLTANTFQILATLASGASPRSIAFATNGNLFVADSAGNRVFEVTPAGGATVFTSDVTAPYAVAFDTRGALHISDTQKGGRILTFSGNSGNTKDVEINLGDIRGLAFDRGNVAHFLTGAGELRKLVGNMSTLVASSLGDPRLLTARSASTLLVAFKGQTLTDPNNAVFASFGSPTIGGGFVAFRAVLLAGPSGVVSANAPGLWRADAAGTLTLLARKSFPLPGDATCSVVSVTDPILNKNGKIAFTAKYLGATNGVALLTDATSLALAPLVRTGDQAFGLDAGVKYTAFKQVVLADDAGPAFIATVAGPLVAAANNLGLWSSDANGVISLVVRKGDTILVGGNTRKISNFTLFTGAPVTLGHGRHAALGRKFTFSAKLNDGSTAILLAQPGSAPAVLALKNGGVGPAINGALFATLNSPTVTGDGEKFSFLSKLVPNFGGVTSASASAIFKQEIGTNSLVAQKNFAAAGVNGALFATLGHPVMNRGGSLAFSAKMKPGFGGVLSSTAAGLWANTGTGLDVAARQGDTAPGVPGRAKFIAFKQLVLPDTGGVVFVASVAGSGISAANNLGMWADDSFGGTELLLRKGDKLLINGQTRTVNSFKVFTAVLGVTGQSRQFDTEGNVTCAIGCSDGTKALVSFSRP